MTPRPKKGPRLYTREQDGQLRYYADLRSVGRGRVALIPEGETQATTYPVIAQKLLSEILEAIQEQRRDGALLGVRRRATLGEYASEHLVKKKRSDAVTDSWLASEEVHLQAAIVFFGEGTDLASIGVEDVQRFAHYIAELPNRRGGTLAPGTQRQYLNSLSNLFRRAQGEGLVRGANPVQALMDKPGGQAEEARWLEVWEGALLLEAARTYPYLEAPDDASTARRLQAAIREILEEGEAAEEEFVRRMREAGKLATAEKLRSYLHEGGRPMRDYMRTAARVLELPEERLYRPRGWLPPARISPVAYPIIGTYLLTGVRESELYGLEMRDVDLEREIVVVRVTKRRRLKTKTSTRIIPLWPQLREILEPHLEQRRAEGAGAGDRDLLLPSRRTGGLRTDVRKMLDAVAARVGWEPGDIRTKMFRHSYASARLQTLDGGHPVSLYTVGKELGHGGDALVKKVYGHLGRIRHRSEHMEYRIEQQKDAIPTERLRLLLRAA